MFENFFGILIVSASALLIAALALRPTPNLPAKMSLGIVGSAPATTQRPPATAEEKPATEDKANQTAAPVTAKTETQDTVTPGTPSVEQPAEPSKKINNTYLQIRQRAIEISNTASSTPNKSDANKFKDN